MRRLAPVTGTDGRHRLHLWRCGDPYFDDRRDRLGEWTCGRFSHWPNPPSGVRHLDLRSPLPFEDGVFHAAAVTRVIEHLAPEAAAGFTRELARVLRPGAVLRISFPDLEDLARSYLASIAAAAADPCEANLLRRDWREAELFDPLVRRRTGGRMRELMVEGRFDESDLEARFGDVWEIFAGTPALDRPPPTALRQWLGLLRSPKRWAGFLASPREAAAAMRARRTVDPRETFESHEWMWDRESATALLEQAGFRSVRPMAWNESAIEGWSRYDLDRSRSGDRHWEPAAILECERG